MAGPRYTYTAWSSAREGPRFQIFGQGLFGGVFAFNGVFPATSGAVSSASSQAVQAGGGINIFLTPHIGVRVAEADYVRNELPNNGNNTQNDLRLSAGLVFHLGPGEQHARVTLGCSPSSVLIYQGDPLTLTARVGEWNEMPMRSFPGREFRAWRAAQRRSTCLTGSLAPGTYTAAGTIKEGKPGKEGLKPWETANCSAVFTVQAIEPPTISPLVQPQHDQARRQEHNNGYGRESSEPTADLQLFGCNRHHQRCRHFSHLRFDGSSHRRGGNHLQSVG